MTSREVIRRRVRVSGRVQGVYYRASTREQARARGLVGWVRNLPDRSVELEVEGDPDGVAALVQWCHEGPPAAQVSEVIEEPAAVLGSESEFRVRY